MRVIHRVIIVMLSKKEVTVRAIHDLLGGAGGT